LGEVGSLVGGSELNKFQLRAFVGRRQQIIPVDIPDKVLYVWELHKKSDFGN